ncbi:MAG: hypothetical protein HFF84_05405 [Oscillibacter sp.]|nr:hypothetical protein [Oscillibacter sp.]
METGKIVSGKEAAAAIQDGSTIVVCGCENILLPDYLLQRLEERFLETGHPCGLTEIHTVIHGMGPGLGLEHFAHEGMTSRVIGSGYSFLKTSQMSALIRENRIPAYIMPMGTVFQMLDNVASGETYTYSKVGIGTFVDSAVEGGCMNDCAENTLCWHETVCGEDMLCYKNEKIDAAILRGTTADEFGNISLEKEPMTLGVKAAAMAAKASGGKVIVQVERIVKRGTIDPQKVMIPGIMVDMVVLDENQPASGGGMNPALTGEIRIPVSALEPLPLDITKVISRRAAREIAKKNAVVNLGVGIPVNIPMIQVEQQSDQETIFFPEHGAIGGVPAGRAIFGTNINPEAIIDSTEVFRFYRGGGLTQSFLGFGEIDQYGNVNVSKFNGIIPGCGGFIDIAHRTPKLVFCGSFTAGGAEIVVENGRLVIRKEGKYRKLVEKVEQITLNGQEALRKNQDVTYITERAVFKLTAQGLELTEIAPGVDMQKDVIDLIPFPIVVHSPVEMDADLFR